MAADTGGSSCTTAAAGRWWYFAPRTMLSSFSGLLARNAKLIIWNGTTDTSVSPKDNSRYYDNVVAAMGQADADKVVELFLAPGVGHCFGGVGLDGPREARARREGRRSRSTRTPFRGG